MKIHFNSKAIGFVYVILAAGVLSTTPGWCGTEVVVIPIQHRNAAESGDIP